MVVCLQLVQGATERQRLEHNVDGFGQVRTDRILAGRRVQKWCMREPRSSIYPTQGVFVAKSNQAGPY